MPFTLAHPAIVLPLRRQKLLPLIPLIIGSMVPDVMSFAPYRLRWLMADAHSLSGLIPTDLPLGCLILLVAVLLRRQLIAPLWGAHRTLVQTSCDQFLSQRWWWLTSIPALLVGAFTHLLWDSFTHADRWMVRRLPWLQQPLIPDSDHPLHIFHALQYISSAMGLLLIGWFYWRAIRKVEAASSNDRSKQIALLAALVFALVCGAAFALHLPREWMSLYRVLAIASRIGMACFIFVYLIIGLVCTYVEYRQTRRTTNAQ
jgi:Domain of unknown function (DUF4184)